MAHSAKGEIIKSLNRYYLDELNLISCTLTGLESEADVRETLEVCLDTIQIYSQMVGELRKILNMINKRAESDHKTDREIIEFINIVFCMTYESAQDNYYDAGELSKKQSGQVRGST